MASRNSTRETAVCISKNEDGILLFDLPNLKNILCSPKVVDKRVAVVAVTGDHRSGKSFLPNYILRYLKAGGEEDWIGEPNEPLVGFDWCGGLESVTKDISTWNKLYPIKTNNDEDIFVMLIDTPTDDHLRTRYQDFFRYTRVILLPRIPNQADGLRSYDGRHSELGDEFIEHYKSLIKGIFEQPISPQKSILDKKLTCGDLYKYCEGINDVIRDEGGIENISILQADFLYYLTETRKEYTEYYMNVINERMENYLSSVDDLIALDELHAELRKEGEQKLNESNIPSDVVSEQCAILTESLNFSYIFLREYAQALIPQREKLHDKELSDRVFEEYVQQMRSVWWGYQAYWYIMCCLNLSWYCFTDYYTTALLPIHASQKSHRHRGSSNTRTLLETSRDIALQTLEADLKSTGSFREAILDGMKAKMTVHGNRLLNKNTRRRNPEVQCLSS